MRIQETRSSVVDCADAGAASSVNTHTRRAQVGIGTLYAWSKPGAGDDRPKSGVLCVSNTAGAYDPFAAVTDLTDVRLFENTLQLPPEAPEEPFNGPRHALLHCAAMDRTEPRRHVVILFEVLRVDGTSLDGLQV